MALQLPQPLGLQDYLPLINANPAAGLQANADAAAPDNALRQAGYGQGGIAGLFQLAGIGPSLSAQVAAQSALAQQQQQIRQQQQAQASMQAYLANPTPNTLNAALTLNPQAVAGIKAGHDALDADAQRVALEQYSALQGQLAAGNVDRARALIQGHIDSDKAAGRDTAADEATLAALDSPEGAARAQATIRLKLAAILGPKAFGELVGPEETARHNQADEAVAQAKAAEEARHNVASENRPIVAADGSVVLGPTGAPRAGGGPPGHAGASAPLASAQDIQGIIGAPVVITSGARTPAHNAEVGGVPNSRHLTDQARDFVPQGISTAEAANRLRAAGYHAIDEGSHVHVDWGGPAPQAASGGANVLFDNRHPKPGYRAATPQEVAALGLPENTPAQVSPEGKIEVIPGTAASLRPVPAGPGTAIADRRQIISKIDRAIAAVRANPESVGMIGYTPDMILQRTDPGGVATRAGVGEIGGQIVHDRSGAAVTAAEEPRLRPYVPKPTDTAETIITKLERLRTNYAGELSALESEFGEGSGYRQPGTSPAPKAAAQPATHAAAPSPHAPQPSNRALDDVASGKLSREAFEARYGPVSNWRRVR